MPVLSWLWRRLRRGWSFWPPPFVVYNFLVICLVFQVFLVNQLPFLYYFLEGLFFLEMAALFYAFIRVSRRNKVFLLAFALIIAVRIPFYLQGDGLIFHSDNALEALQPLEIQDSHRAPFFLLNSSGHNGTLKYLFVAFIWDVLGKSYTTFVLFQLLIFLVFIYLFYEIFRRFAAESVVRVLLFAHFAFIEVIFDYSLFLRAAPYLEMLTVFLLGIYLLDFSFEDKRKLFLGFYFLIFSAYLHPLVVFLIVPFGVVTILLSLPARKFGVNLLALLAGGALATYHLIYYKFFWPPPPPSGEWYRIVFFSPAQFSFGQIPVYLKNLGRDLWVSFHNLFDYEFLYSLDFFQARGWKTLLLKILNRLAIFGSLAVGLVGLGVSLRNIIKRLRASQPVAAATDSAGKLTNPRGVFSRIEGLPWVYLFVPLAFAVFVFKAFILSPRPYYEPRHNIDMALWIGVCFVLCFGALFERFKSLRRSKWFHSLMVVLLLALSAPHYIYYLKIAIFKKESYAQIIPVLRENRVRYLATDFSLAYPVYFLTDRRVKVTDSFGPVSVPFFYYWLREEVDKIPWEKKAYLFFGDRYFRRSWHIKATTERKRQLINRLNSASIDYQVINFPFYTIVIPQTAVNPKTP